MYYKDKNGMEQATDDIYNLKNKNVGTAECLGPYYKSGVNIIHVT